MILTKLIFVINLTCPKIHLYFDSGATSHMMYSKEGLTNLKPWRVHVKVGSAANIYSEMKGTYRGLVTQEGGMYYTFQICILVFFHD
jgi:hypothetical protein